MASDLSLTIQGYHAGDLVHTPEYRPDRIGHILSLIPAHQSPAGRDMPNRALVAWPGQTTTVTLKRLEKVNA